MLIAGTIRCAPHRQFASGTAGLQEAVATYRAALEECTRERVPLKPLPKPTSRRRAQPSLGRPDPSQADIALTQDIKKAAAPIGLVLHDHLIIGGNSHTSVRDLKLI